MWGNGKANADDDPLLLEASESESEDTSCLANTPDKIAARTPPKSRDPSAWSLNSQDGHEFDNCDSDFRIRLSPDLVTSVFLRTTALARRKVACACGQFSEIIRLGRELGLFRLSASCSAAGIKHTMVATTEGELYTFGSGANGMLGHGTDDNEALPRVVEALSHVHVCGVATGNNNQTTIKP